MLYTESADESPKFTTLAVLEGGQKVVGGLVGETFELKEILAV